MVNEIARIKAIFKEEIARLTTMFKYAPKTLITINKPYTIKPKPNTYCIRLYDIFLFHHKIEDVVLSASQSCIRLILLKRNAKSGFIILSLLV